MYTSNAIAISSSLLILNPAYVKTLSFLLKFKQNIFELKILYKERYKISYAHLDNPELLVCDSVTTLP